jgi:hypothetical protein
MLRVRSVEAVARCGPKFFCDDSRDDNVSSNSELVYSFLGARQKHRDGKGLAESRHLQH